MRRTALALALPLALAFGRTAAQAPAPDPFDDARAAAFAREGFPAPPAGKIRATYGVLAYNVENLFDTLDAPGKSDEDYLPDSEWCWGTARYRAKLDSLAHVIGAAAGARPLAEGPGRYRADELPALIALTEVENAAVCADLARALAGEGAYAVHTVEGPDVRGIDGALLVRRGTFRVRAVSGIRLDFPEALNPPDMAPGERYTSRDILHVRGRFRGMKRDLHVFVNHWPSRRGGLEASAPRRAVAARALRAAVDSLRGADGAPYVLIVGDFNDEPPDASLTEVLGASREGAAPPQGLANLTGPADAAGLGTYNYRGEWNFLDQLIVSGALLPDAGGRWAVAGARPFRAEWMLYRSDRFGPTPSRTFGGPNYYAGYSDHLPVVATLYRVKP